jgi:hypothetical protein
VTFHWRVEVWPGLTEVGAAVKEDITGGTGITILTGVDLVMEPELSEAVSVYVVSAEGDTTDEPAADRKSVV